MRTYFLLALIICLISFGYAFQVDAYFENDIFVKGVDSSIDFYLDFKNVTPGYYSVYTFANFQITPAEIFYLENDTRVNFSISPKGEFENTKYIFSYTISKIGGSSPFSVEKKFSVKFLDFEDMVKIETNNIDFENGVVKVYVENSEDYEFKNISASFSSILFNFNKSFNLGRKETKIFDVVVNENLLKTTKAGTYVLDGIFNFIGGSKKQIYGKLYLDAKTGIKSEDSTSGILIRKNIIKKINEGNTVEYVNIKVSKDPFSRMFTNLNIEPTTFYREGFRIYYSWDHKLSPNESFEVIVKTNYFYFILILCIIGAFVYFILMYLKIKIDIKKKIVPIKTKNGEFALRVSLNIRAKADVKDVILSDSVPSTVKLYNKFSSIQPDEIDVSTRRMKWKIGDLKNGEERAYSYVVYSRVGYVGRFSLPRAFVRYKIDDLEKREYSKEVFFLAEQADVEKNTL